MSVCVCPIWEKNHSYTLRPTTKPGYSHLYQIRSLKKGLAGTRGWRETEERRGINIKVEKEIWKESMPVLDGWMDKLKSDPVGMCVLF